MNLAIVSARVLPRPDPDLGLLHAAAARRGWSASILAWDAPGVDWGSFDAVLLRSTWDYLPRVDEFRAWIASTARVTNLVQGDRMLLWNLHKSYMLDLASNGAPIVPTRLVRAGTAVAWSDCFAEHGDLVVKPAVSAGSFATIRVRAGDAASAEAHRVEHADRDLLVQPCLPSVLERGETNIVLVGGCWTHAVRKGARWQGDAEQSRGIVEPSSAELDAVDRVMHALGRCGFPESVYARVDLADGPDGAPCLMELELVEPSLFLDRRPSAADRLLEAVAARTGR